MAMISRSWAHLVVVGPWRARLAAACAQYVGLGPATLLLCGVATLCFDTEYGVTGSAEPGFQRITPPGAKDHRWAAHRRRQVLDGGGFSLMVHALEGGHAEHTTTLQVLSESVPGHSSAHGRDRGCRRGHDRRSEQARSRRPGCHSSSGPPTCLDDQDLAPGPIIGTEIPDGHVFTRALARRSSRTSGSNTHSSTDTGPAMHGARCAASSRRSPRSRRPSPGRSSSSATRACFGMGQRCQIQVRTSVTMVTWSAAAVVSCCPVAASRRSTS